MVIDHTQFITKCRFDRIREFVLLWHSETPEITVDEWDKVRCEEQEGRRKSK